MISVLSHDNRHHGSNPDHFHKRTNHQFIPFHVLDRFLTGPKSDFEIKVSRKIGCILTCNEVHFVSLADNFTVPFSKLLKLPSLMENKTA